MCQCSVYEMAAGSSFWRREMQGWSMVGRDFQHFVVALIVLSFFSQSYGNSIVQGKVTYSDTSLSYAACYTKLDGEHSRSHLQPSYTQYVGTAHYGEDSVGSYPYFEYNVPRNVTTVVGQTAFLHCRVEQLGDKAVSWIRKRDLHILTAGILTYTSDQRFQVIRPDKSENWTLQIKFPQERDAGTYECQVNTEPKMSLAFNLNVVEAKAHILGPSDLYVKTGSALSLTCILSQGPHDLGTIFWYKGSTLIEHQDIESNDISDVESRIRLKTAWTEQLTSRLMIDRVLLSDSGNYSCVPTMAEATSVNVHVINGEHPAAMQHGNTNTASPCAISVNLVMTLYCTIAYFCTSTGEYFR